MTTLLAKTVSATLRPPTRVEEIVESYVLLALRVQPSACPTGSDLHAQWLRDALQGVWNTRRWALQCRL